MAKEILKKVQDDLGDIIQDPKETYHLRKVILKGSKKELKNIVLDYWSTLIQINKIREKLGYTIDDDQLEPPLKGGE